MQSRRRGLSNRRRTRMKRDEQEDKDAKLDDFDDGRGDFVVVNRRRARSYRGTGGGGTAQ